MFQFARQRSLYSVVFIASLSACGGPGRQAAPHPRALEDSLESELLKIHRSKTRLVACDNSNSQAMLELVQAIDARKVAIANAAKAKTPTSDYKQVEVGPSIFLERVTPLRALVVGWRQDDRSWSDIYNYYQKNKDKPVGEEWLKINSHVRSLLLEDGDRLIYEANMRLAKDSGPALQAAWKKVMDCIQTTGCDKLVFDEPTKFLIEGSSYNKYWLEQSMSNPSSDNLKKLLEGLEVDLSRYDIHENSSIVRKDKNTLIVPLGAGPFAGYEKLLSAPLESTWQTPDLQVKLDWTSADTEIFKILLHDAIGERPYVEFRHRTMNLFPLSTFSVFEHEFGHVMGIPDHYYTLWDEDHCKYTYQTNESDIMSSSTFGKPLPEEFTSLDTAYPFKSN